MAVCTEVKTITINCLQLCIDFARFKKTGHVTVTHTNAARPQTGATFMHGTVSHCDCLGGRITGFSQVSTCKARAILEHESGFSEHHIAMGGIACPRI